ncbi:DUF885 domain-containing protein [Sandaracinobacter sp. RS1-74]|uniref:DUF885 domain-containing protein n=1 Tax=Sandaracinobacteroides sayramensis TaxID=2913411 RepID=UPI001EDC85DF|nr:DUF885 domain-containing protein [Sandaracinobacteroides sayramensis]MCG2839818.1 DUF885 domain-containing protein [Sandaracinobacteroides sayramensis]
MLKSIAPLFALLLSTAALPGAVAAQPAPATAEATAQADRALAALFDRYDKATLARSPQAKAYRGVRDGDYGKWNDPSDAKAAADLAEDVAFLAEMRRDFAQAPLSADSRLSYRLFEKQMERRVAAAKYRDLDLTFDQMNGAQSGLPAFLINIHRIGNVAEAEAYLERLRGLGPLMDQLVAISAKRAQAGAAAPAWVYPHVVNDARALLKGAPFEAGADSSLLADFRGKVQALKLPAAEEARLVAEAEKALRDGVGPAYRRLIPAMEAEAKLSRPGDGVGRLASGADYYAERLRFHTTTGMTPDEVHQLGLDEVARIHGEMRALMPALGVKGDLPDLFAHVRASDALFFPDTEEGRAAYLQQAEAALARMEARLPEAFSTLPKAPLVVKRVEAFREKSAGKAFYSRPAPDGSRPGTYYANLYNMREMPKYEIEALAFHEGLPGHHLQLAVQTELKDVPAFRKFGGFTAYSEGWGLYSEQLPHEMGMYSDAWQEFGRLKMDLWRAIRLVTDTGLHHKGWSREQAIRYHMENTPSDEAEVVRAVERYAIFPGQANAYAIGKLEILKLREEAKAKMGDRFDLKGFHDVVLKSGAVPLDVLAENVRLWSGAAPAVARR